ncbi:hypothetical protein P152DRAFT_441467 [Eremomyces bilateralis CBS 781.70]|uniref:DUF676 domain-containing protein n=1 Tax=Eremomyces bilateralis CBS 781.70 TaxID=1392243 RepID=A0A6G1FV95_9PEZI|nr:uncharacterized protein P152DRAFT_441467 [Eremomyces bilateralis CBS 781.70]KAF1809628.1 hypothetical protein P152DRAFT_441467 [Eremomyces bilateralis CBS 781.70]
MPISFTPSQTGRPGEADLPFTGNPFKLLWKDLLLCFHHINTIPGIIRPWNPFTSHESDELHLSLVNIKCIVIHGILIVLQTSFLVSVPVLVFTLFPAVWVITYILGFVALNTAICRLLNGTERTLQSSKTIQEKAAHQKEYWIYLNGVSVGRDWIQANINRLSMTFRRPVVGVHNPTAGIVFDMIECLIQRNFCYATADVRNAHSRIKEALLDRSYEKIIFILHSQGGIMGGLIIDWLLDELPHDCLNRLEVYTFGNAANHFNNPLRGEGSEGGPNGRKAIKAIRHVEHYANEGEFVANFGVLHFFWNKNRFMGRLFRSSNSGHLLNQHYLAECFPLDENDRVLESNPFMDMVVEHAGEAEEREHFTTELQSRGGDEVEEPVVADVNSPLSPTHTATLHTHRVKDFSRLWLYRNGRSPTS